MKKKQVLDLEQEYVPNDAAKAREAERERLARWQAGAAARDAEHRAIAAEQARKAALPITDRDELSKHVADLAAAFGLKRKGRRP